MSSAKTTLTLAAIFIVAAFAGILVTEDVDAAEGDYTVTVSAGGATLPYTATAGSITMPTAEAVAAFYTVPEGYELTAWRDVATGALYTPGQGYTITQDMTVEPYLTIDGYAVTFVIGETSIIIPVGDSGSDKVVISEEVDAAVKAYADTGYRFDGWSVDGETILSEEQVEAANVTAAITYTASFTAIYDIAWVVDGVTIATGTTGDELVIPEDPAKEHYTFIAWTVDGVAVDPVKYEITADVSFVALFEAKLVVVTFMAGEETVGTVEVRYGNLVNAIELPEGYVGWDFDFSTPITEAVTIKAVETPAEEPSTVYTITLMVDGATYMTLSSDKLPASIATPAKDGYDFVGWMAQGETVYSDPLTYTYTGDVVFVAMYSVAPEPVAPEPAFYETTMGQVVLVLVGFLALALIGAYVTNQYGMQDKLKALVRRKSKGGDKE